MFKALLVLIAVVFALPFAALMLAPVLLLLPLLLPLAGFALVAAVLIGALRLSGTVLAGAFSLVLVVAAAAVVLTLGAVVFGIAIGLLHLLLPVVLLAAIVYGVLHLLGANSAPRLPPSAV